MNIRKILIPANVLVLGLSSVTPVYASNADTWYNDMAMVHLDQENVEIYEEADADSTNVGTLNAGDLVTVEATVFAEEENSTFGNGEISSEWFRITTEDGIQGYVSSSLLAYEEEVQEELLENGRLSASSYVNLEAETEEDNTETVSIYSSETYTVTSISENEITLEVEGESVTVTNHSMEFTVAESEEEIRAALVEYACSFIGNPYVYGGSSLTNGTDCSGFTMRIFENYGISLPHSSSAQRSYGTAISADELQAGDLVCYSGHVAIYIGDGQIVHAANSRKGIIISDMSYMTPIAYRSLLS